MTHDIKFPDEREEEAKARIELEALRSEIKAAHDHLEALQGKHRKLTGQDYRVAPLFIGGIK